MTSPWVGFATAHVVWMLAFVAWWWWLTPGQTDRTERAQRDFETARRTIRDQRHMW